MGLGHYDMHFCACGMCIYDIASCETQRSLMHEFKPLRYVFLCVWCVCVYNIVSCETLEELDAWVHCSGHYDMHFCA